MLYETLISPQQLDAWQNGDNKIVRRVQQLSKMLSKQMFLLCCDVLMCVVKINISFVVFHIYLHNPALRNDEDKLSDQLTHKDMLGDI